jgi:hypothetical protein
LLHAENIFVETALEGGIVGLALLVLGVAVLLRRFLRSLGHMADPWGGAAAIAGLYVLVSQCVQNLMDLGAYVPANMLWASIALGTAWGSTALARKNAWSSDPAATPQPRTAAWPVGTFALLVGTLGLFLPYYWPYGPLADRLRELQRFRERRVPIKHTQYFVDDLRAKIHEYPYHSEAHTELAQLLLYQYAVAVQESHGEGEWFAYSLESLFEQAHQAIRNQDAQKLHALRAKPLVVRYLVPARQHAQAARRRCPLNARAQLIAGQLAWLAEPPESDEQLFAWAAWAARADPSVLIPVGAYHLLAGRSELATATFRRVAELNPTLGDSLSRVYNGLLRPEDIRPPGPGEPRP